MSRHIDFRDDRDMAFGGIVDDIANLVLCIEAPVFLSRERGQYFACFSQRESNEFPSIRGGIDRNRVKIRYSGKEKPRRIYLRDLQFLAEKEGFEPSRPVIFDLHP